MKEDKGKDGDFLGTDFCFQEFWRLIATVCFLSAHIFLHIDMMGESQDESRFGAYTARMGEERQKV